MINSNLKERKTQKGRNAIWAFNLNRWGKEKEYDFLLSPSFFFINSETIAYIDKERQNKGKQMFIRILLALILCLMVAGCLSVEEASTIKQKEEPRFKEYPVIMVEGQDTEIKDWFGYTVDVIENDYYLVTYQKGEKKETVQLNLGEYGLHKLRTSQNGKNCLMMANDGWDTHPHIKYWQHTFIEMPLIPS